PGRDDARPAGDVDEHARSRRRAAGGRDRADAARRPQMKDAFHLDGKPSITATGTEMRSYYGRPIVKEPVWTWEIPAYFFTGGLAGASSVLSSAARLAGNEELARTSLYVGAAASMFVHPRDAGPARRLAVAGVLAEGALTQAMELRLGKVGEVYRQDAAGKFSWAAKGLAIAGTALLARRGRKSRTAAVMGGALVCAGELCLRWAVFKAGFQSARDPSYLGESP